MGEVNLRWSMRSCIHLEICRKTLSLMFWVDCFLLRIYSIISEVMLELQLICPCFFTNSSSLKFSYLEA